MKRFLFLALALVGCVTSPDNGSSAADQIPTGTYSVVGQTTRQLILSPTSATFKAFDVTPNVVIECGPVKILLDTSIDTTTGEKIHRTAKNLVIAVNGFYQIGNGGTRLPMDSSKLESFMFGKNLDFFAAHPGSNKIDHFSCANNYCAQISFEKGWIEGKPDTSLSVYFLGKNWEIAKVP